MNDSKLSLQKFRRCFQHINQLPQYYHYDYQYLFLPYAFTSYILYDAYCIATFPFHFLSTIIDHQYENDDVEEEVKLSFEKLNCHQIANDLIISYENLITKINCFFFLNSLNDHHPIQIDFIQCAKKFIQLTEIFINSREDCNQQNQYMKCVIIKEQLLKLYATKWILPIITLKDNNQNTILKLHDAKIAFTQMQLQCQSLNLYNNNDHNHDTSASSTSNCIKQEENPNTSQFFKDLLLDPFDSLNCSNKKKIKVHSHHYHFEYE